MKFDRFLIGISLSILLTSIASSAMAAQARLDVAVGTPAVLAGEKQTTYLRVALHGLPLQGQERPPANVCVVLDRSGSMSGEKIARAKEAAAAAVEALRGADVFSLVTYDTEVEVVVPATRVTERQYIRDRIAGIESRGNTALYAGVCAGATEVRKFIDGERVNRLILLSDGLANNGPSTPEALGDLGASLASEGITVSTVGLGLDYNEDLMTALAQRSDGNHFYARSEDDLYSVVTRELGEVASVVARDVTLRVVCDERVRPVRAVGREADISGQTITSCLRQLYGDQTKYLVIEVELPAGETGEEMRVAEAEISYTSMASQEQETLRCETNISYVASAEEVRSRTNAEVMVSAVQQIGAERNRLAMKLRDEGKLDEGLRVLRENVDYLSSNAARYGSTALESDGKLNGSLVTTWLGGPADGKALRKEMREYQHSIMNQQENRNAGWIVPNRPFCP